MAQHGLVARMMAAMVLLVLVYAMAIGLALLIGVAPPVVAATVALVVLPQWWSTEWMARRLARARIAGPDELTVAMAHEVAHIRHRDVAVMTLAGSLAVAMAWGARVATTYVRKHSKPVPFGQRLRDLPIVFLLVAFGGWIVLMGLVSVLAQLPLRTLSRYRELAADHDAALQTGQPALLAATLLKIGGCDAVPDLRTAVRVPVPGLVAARPGRYAWWSTHPAIAERVDRLT
ncbi:M48 family metalloprotease [Nonomuraea sp. NPDC050643]|uniref:M48 family metallopeptidase n=1 Tax=Nonomuraea sp. NPDC050643 TaxID=3155660 RepID=UPI0033DA7F8A